jgi:hypothetical protein
MIARQETAARDRAPPVWRWKTALVGVAGVWMIASIFVLDFHAARLAMVHTGVSGVLLVLLGLWATLRFRRWVCLASLAVGLWIVEAPWVFDFVAIRATALNTLLVGGIVFLLALWALLDEDRLAS